MHNNRSMADRLLNGIWYKRALLDFASEQKIQITSKTNKCTIKEVRLASYCMVSGTKWPILFYMWKNLNFKEKNPDTEYIQMQIKIEVPQTGYYMISGTKWSVLFSKWKKKTSKKKILTLNASKCTIKSQQ